MLRKELENLIEDDRPFNRTGVFDCENGKIYEFFIVGLCSVLVNEIITSNLTIIKD